jgi:hypothetical protein
MSLYEQSILTLVAPLVVAYVALLGIGYLRIDVEHWRHRNRAPEVRSVTASPSDLAAEAERSLSRLPPRAVKTGNRWFHRTISACRPRPQPFTYK